MASDIDATVPADNVKADKSLIRANFLAAKNEIEDLQRETGLAARLAFDPTMEL
jgi:hypothetical protein